MGLPEHTISMIVVLDAPTPRTMFWSFLFFVLKKGYVYGVIGLGRSSGMEVLVGHVNMVRVGAQVVKASREAQPVLISRTPPHTIWI